MKLLWLDNVLVLCLCMCVCVCVCACFLSTKFSFFSSF